MILSSTDILGILGGNGVIRLSAKLSIVDGKPALSGAEGLFIYIDRFPRVDEFQATWSIYIESDGNEPDDLVLAEIRQLLPSVSVKPGLLTTVTTTDFLSENTQRPPTTKPAKAQPDLRQYEKRFQALVEDVQDQMLLVNSGRPGRDGKDGRDGIDGRNGRDGKDLIATDAELFDLKDVDQSILPMEKGQVLTWDGAKWTNLFVRQSMSAGGAVAGDSGGTGPNPSTGVTQIVAGANVTISPAEGTGIVEISSSSGSSDVQVLDDLDDVTTGGAQNGQFLQYNSTSGGWEPVTIAPGSGIEEAPQDGSYYVRQDGQWINLENALAALGITGGGSVIDGGDFSGLSPNAIVSGGDFTTGEGGDSSAVFDAGDITTGSSSATNDGAPDGGNFT